MKSRMSICILLCLAILATGMAVAQDELVVVADKVTYEAAVQAAAQAYCPPYGQAAVASETYGTKVKAGDPDVGLPLSPFSPSIALSGIPGLGVTPQNLVFLSYWDVGTTPGSFDNQDVVYLQFGSTPAGAGRIVRANNIRMTGWGNYPAGSYVNQGDSDIGQQLLPNGPAPAVFPTPTSFAYMEVDGGLGYGLDDPVYIKLQGIPVTTGTNDVRLTPFAGYPAGSMVSNADSDAARPLLPFYATPALPAATAGGAPAATSTPLGILSFYNANGNIFAIPPNQAIYDGGDAVYFDVTPINVVSPNDIRLF